MKFYQLSTVFTFGKHQGKTLKEIVETAPSYINWCIMNLNHFYIDEPTIQNLKELNSVFSLSQDNLNKLASKYSEMIEEDDKYYDDSNDYYEDYASAYDNPYYNENLDMDQQSMEFWDNL